MNERAPPCSRHVSVFALASVELRGIVRSHPFRIFLPVGVLFVILAPSLVLFAFDSRDAMIVQLGISTAALFATLLGLAAGAGSAASDRETGRAEVVRARPVGPLDWLLGKWIGIAVATAGAVAILGAVHLASVGLRGGPPAGYAPILGALFAAAVGGSLAGALALGFSSFLRSGPAFLASLGALLAGHAVALLGQVPALEVVAFLLPRSPELNLAPEAAFGTLPAGVVLAVGIHGIAWSLFALALAAAASVARTR